MGLASFFLEFQVVFGKGVVFFLGDDAGFEANTYNDFTIQTKGDEFYVC